MQRWAKPDFKYIGYTYHGEPSEAEKELTIVLDGVRNQFYEAQANEKTKTETAFDWIGRCKELIYDVVDGVPRFHAIALTFNVSRAELEVAPLFDILVEADSPARAADEIRSTLAYALFSEVPVFANTQEFEAELARHYRELMLQGFSAPDGAGKRVRLIPAGSPGKKLDSVGFLFDISSTRPRQPAEITLIREVVAQELNKLSTADRVLASLSIAINELASRLNATTRNESLLQECLTAHPILFGLEYQRIIPKHMLGAEFEMDYALERVSGLVDLVEIEASTHRLFNKAGDPRKELIHAEQQVLDWLNWLERNHSYAREKLPGLLRPKGYVVIGRTEKLTEVEHQKLARRNVLFGDRLQILTYNDLLSRAKNMQQLLLRSATTVDGE